MVDFKKRLQHYFKVFSIRFFGVRRELRYLFFLSIFSILLSETILKNISSFNNFQNVLGIIFVKICYSYVSAFIFYYLVVYLPKERKKVKGYRIIGNNIGMIIREIEDIILKVYRCPDPQITAIKDIIDKEEIRKRCLLIKPNEPIYMYNTDIILFDSFLDFLDFKLEKIQFFYNQLIVFNELLDDDVFESITNICCQINMQKIYDKREIFTIPNMEFLSIDITEFYLESQLLNENFKKYSERYSFQYHHDARKMNLSYRQKNLR